MSRDLLFCLGGRDLEMSEIARLVGAERGEEALLDLGLSWRTAVASAYRGAIEAALAAGRTPVLVELRPDLPEDLLARCRLVDHHGDRAGARRPTSLEQVFALLALGPDRWTRRLALVAANDRGWIPELRAIGATAEEIARIRAEDRAAQGIGPAEEAAAEPALDAASRPLPDLLYVRLPHDRVAVVTDRLGLAAESDPPEVLVEGPGGWTFSGGGERVLALARAFPGGWWGGALPERGFWGTVRGATRLDAILGVLARPEGPGRARPQGTSPAG